MRAMKRSRTALPDTLLAHAGATLRLRRWPRRRNETLRAWDGADLYLLDEMAAHGAAEWLVLNDHCGALALAHPASHSGGDSWLARAAWLANAADNDIAVADDAWCWPDQPWPQNPQGVVVRVPKQLALLEYQLWRIATELPVGTPVWLAWMDKHLPGNLLALVRRYLPELDLLRGRHKAHGLRAVVTGEAVPEPPYPSRVAVPGTDWTLSVHAGVFSQAQLDIGARAFMPHIPAGRTGRIVDLGCGNGVIGLLAAQRNPDAEIIFCDESWQALQSARENASRYASSPVAFHLGNGLDGLQGEFDLILLNPPFHRGHAIDDGVAKVLFKQAAGRLTAGGELRVIGNRHLRYGVALKRYFSSVTVLAQGPKFTVFSACQS